MDKFDTYMDEWSAPMPEAPQWLPEAIPMQETKLVDIAEGAESGKTYIEEDSSGREARKAEGLLAPPIDIYEPGFRTDLVAAIKSYWQKQRDVRANNDRIRKITGIGRTH